MQSQDPTQASHLSTSLEVDPASLDFGLTTLPPASSTDQTALSTFMIEVRHRLSRLESAHAQIAQLKSALAESEAARQALAAELTALKSQSTTNATSSTPTPVVQSAPHTHTTTAPTPSPQPTAASSNATQSSFTLVESKKSGKKRKNKPIAPPPPNAKKASATIARLFAPHSDIPSGYQFVYFSTPVRRRLSVIRRLIQAIGLNNSRYPVQDVISFLVHNDYVLTFTKTMHLHGRGSSPMVEFDPCDPIHLKDPQFVALSPDLRQQKAKEIENLRCLRALSFIRCSVRLSVARCFLHYDRINQKQFDAILSQELTHRAASSASRPAPKSSDEERLAKKQRLSYLGFLLHHDPETVSLLAYPATDSAMADSPAA
ncbi:hypothetical protein MBANPS3_012406 [Mucor bainieri]